MTSCDSTLVWFWPLRLASGRLMSRMCTRNDDTISHIKDKIQILLTPFSNNLNIFVTSFERIVAYWLFEMYTGCYNIHTMLLKCVDFVQCFRGDGTPPGDPFQSLLVNGPLHIIISDSLRHIIFVVCQACHLRPIWRQGICNRFLTDAHARQVSL